MRIDLRYLITLASPFAIFWFLMLFLWFCGLRTPEEVRLFLAVLTLAVSPPAAGLIFTVGKPIWFRIGRSEGE